MESLEQEVGAPAPGEDVGKRLDGERAHLAAMKERLGEAHPDVDRSRKVIATLENELARLASQPRKAFPFKPENPAYINIHAQLSSATASIGALRNSRIAIKKRAEEYARRMERTSQIEPEYLDLQRDRESSVRKYHEIRSRLMEAQVSEGLEIQRKGERFTLIDPPDLPERPERPNRPVIIILAALLASIGGVGAGAASEQLDETIRDPRQLGRAAGLPPLALIPYLADEDELERRRRRRWTVRLAGVGAMVALLILGHFFGAPLDVVWYVVLRKLGLA
jgi:polysaccharide biosynthesis transport protein